jgi:hypothetical protein
MLDSEIRNIWRSASNNSFEVKAFFANIGQGRQIVRVRKKWYTRKVMIQATSC